MHRKKYFSILFLVLTTINQQGYSHRPCRPLNLSIAKQHVEEYYECGQYDRDMEHIINRTLNHFKKVSPHNNATVIFDIDDTLLSDYANEKNIRFGYIPKLFHTWVLRANAPAIQATKKLYDYLVQRGFTIILMTGRKSNEYDATLKNLAKEGFTHFEKLIVRQKDEENMTALKYKTERRKQLTQQGYRIVGNVGDQWSDLRGPYSGYKVKLPNFRYFIP